MPRFLALLAVLIQAQPVLAGKCTHSVTLRVDQDFPADERALLAAAVRQWEVASDGAICFKLTYLELDPREAQTYRSDGKSTIYAGLAAWQKPILDAKPPWAAGFVVWDGRDGNLPWTPDRAADVVMRHRYSFFRTAVHELGHLLGLVHSANPRDIMFYRVVDPEPDQAETISKTDRAVLACLLETRQLRVETSALCEYPSTFARAYDPRLLHRANVSYMARNYRLAARLARDLLRQQPLDPAALQLLGVSACWLRHWSRARAAFDDASEATRDTIRRVCARNDLPIDHPSAR